MKYVIEFAGPSLADNSAPEDVAFALGKILNKDLRFYWNAEVTVTPERTTAE